jgi:hypothetical protein
MHYSKLFNLALLFSSPNQRSNFEGTKEAGKEDRQIAQLSGHKNFKSLDSYDEKLMSIG